MNKMHPISGIVYSFVLLIIVLINENPLVNMVYLTLIIINILILDGRDELINSIKFSLIPVLLIIIINPIVSQAGKTVFIRKRIPLFPGIFVITFEGIMYGINMGIKMLLIFLIFLLYSKLTDKDEVFGFLSRYAHKLTLVFSMSLNIIHRLVLDISRVKEVMISRGIKFQNKSRLKRIKAYYPLLKVILISALEGSISRAEALYSKGYGVSKRTSYYNRVLTVGDLLMIINAAVLFLMNIYFQIFASLKFHFYPQITPITIEEIKLGLILFGIGFTGVLIIWRRNKWRLLEQRI